MTWRINITAEVSQNTVFSGIILTELIYYFEYTVGGGVNIDGSSVGIGQTDFNLRVSKYKLEENKWSFNFRV